MVKGSAGAQMGVVVDAIMKLDTSDTLKNIDGKTNAL